MKKKLGPVEKYKPLWEGGKSVEQRNIKIGFKIRMYCVQELNMARQKNPNLFGQKETDELTKMIMDLKQDKGTISQDDQNCTLEEFQQFLQEFFSSVDYEDRHGTVTMKTSSKFRLMAAFVDVLQSWGPIDPEMLKKKKYCQFKAVDIFKALKRGEVPKRGGPKEQEESLGNEIDELAKNMGDANLGDNNNFNQNQGGNQPFQNNQPTPNQQFQNNQFGGNTQYGGQQQQFNQYGNNNQYGMHQNNNNTGFSNPFGNQNQNNFNNNNMNNMNNKNNNYNQGMPQQRPPQQHPPQPQYPPQQHVQKQQPPQQYHQPQQPQQNRYNPPSQNQNQGGMNKARKSKVFPSTDKNPQKRMFKGKYELNAKIPIKYNSVDYFMLVENVRINNENALRELKRGKASDILNMVVDSLEFLNYIKK